MIWLEQMGNELEKYAEDGNPENCIKQPKKSQTSSGVKLQQLRTIKRGEIVKDKNARLGRWAEHFEEVLVMEASTNPIDENEVEIDEINEMDTTEKREAKVRQTEEDKEWKNTWYRSRAVQSR